MRVISLNANGIRAAIRKDIVRWWSQTSADVLLLQETKLPQAQWDQIRQAFGDDVFIALNPAERKGYSGVGVIARKEPDQISYGLGHSALDAEGRVITLTYGDLHIVNAYFPSGASSPERQEMKLEFLEAMRAYLNRMDSHNGRWLLAGDFNMVHQPKDVHHPHRIDGKPGFTATERAWLDQLTQDGWVDAFRAFNSEPGHYTWWSAMARAKPKNLGWRIDYFWLSPGLAPDLRRCQHLTEANFSDHCPILLELNERN